MSNDEYDAKTLDFRPRPTTALDASRHYLLGGKTAILESRDQMLKLIFNSSKGQVCYLEMPEPTRPVI